jgi:hypothetical protein
MPSREEPTKTVLLVVVSTRRTETDQTTVTHRSNLALQAGHRQISHRASSSSSESQTQTINARAHELAESVGEDAFGAWRATTGTKGGKHRAEATCSKTGRRCQSGPANNARTCAAVERARVADAVRTKSCVNNRQRHDRQHCRRRPKGPPQPTHPHRPTHSITRSLAH